MSLSTLAMALARNHLAHSLTVSGTMGKRGLRSGSGQSDPHVSAETAFHEPVRVVVDAIINFNFDETLDQAIEDEIGPGHYYRVVSDSDCRQPLTDLSQPKGYLRLPLYIKPHGTASSKSSLRFRRGDYFLLPPDLKDLLAALIGGLPLRVLVIGHAMNSFEFNDILGRFRHPDTGCS